MAHVEKFTKASAGHMFKHYERAKDENGEYIKFANQSIDLSKTHLNYNLAPERKSQGDFVKKRCTEDGIRCMNRKDVNVMCSWIVTAPKSLQEEKHSRFFEEVYRFLSTRYGEENVVSAYVHMDESQPHIHFAFVPVVADKKRGGFKVSAKELISKSELLKFHPDLSKHMIAVFGYDIGVENGATALGNQTVEQLKVGSVVLDNLDRKIENKSAQLEKISQKKADIKAVESIEAKNTIFGDKVTIAVDDYENLQTLAQKQIASTKSTKRLKSENEKLKQQNAELSADNAKLKEQSQGIIHLKMENAELKKKVSALENILAKIYEFLERLNLRERLEEFLKSLTHKKKSHENHYE